MALHVIVGSGPVGSTVAAELLARGEDVRVVTRSGSGPDGAERVAADAADSARLIELAQGAEVIYNCANPQYHRWTTDWPPIANALLAAAESSGAVLAITGNLYAIGPVEGPMTESTPERPSSVKGRVRQTMWRDALAAQTAGRIKGAVEVRASDYVGEGPSILSMLVLPRLLKGKSATIPAALDVRHTWSNPADEARLLVKAAGEPRAWGRVWHLPSAPAVSVRELVAIAAGQLGLGSYRLISMPRWVLSVAGLVNTDAKEFAEMNYQFRSPFVLSTETTEAMFGTDFTPLAESVKTNLTWLERQTVAGK
ncbi:NAD-dependent epimerase/dehydratase family protein [Jatrophihabitans telluris]|uniref:NAD-dependent epimerase/dehydratase family protein n=1 Tax=Jatrophihabitans telluris TaxID=2038343 RepID=A0ABY4R1K6_9ACTN|nr:NAD-dependent epimerase/dehydratase family protein [Jatrophihabitans telluris]UQX89151.1 NAD-dependent epimerase/dehydratase family protein [Jatrophihabitans telluris]